MERGIYRSIPEILSTETPVLFTGPRNSGKSTLLKRIQHVAQEEQGLPVCLVDLQKLYYHYASVHDAAIGALKQCIAEHQSQGKNNRVIFLVDNLSYVSDPIAFVDEVVALFGHAAKFIGTTSTRNYGLLPTYKKDHDNLLIFPLFPLRWREVAINRIPNLSLPRTLPPMDTLKDIYATYGDLLRQHFLVFLRTGGFPRMLHQENVEESLDELEHIFSSYLEFDISRMLRRTSIGQYVHFLRLMAQQVGKPKHYSIMSERLDMHKKTLEQFIRIAENTFLLHYIEPFWTDPKKEIRHRQQVYFLDQALLNYLLTTDVIRMHPTFLSLESIKNVLVSELWKDQYADIRYYQTITKSSIDVVLGKDHDLLPITLEYYGTGSVFTPSLRSFMKKYGERVQGKPIILTEKTLAEYPTHRVIPLSLYLLFKEPFIRQ